jgi:anti-sigma B factor antagonist
MDLVRASTGSALTLAVDRHVIVDLSRVDFCDSTGLRALLDAAREVNVAGGELIAIVPEDGPVRRLVTLTGAQEFLGVTADRTCRERMANWPMT